jgi:hypothetical protein
MLAVVHVKVTVVDVLGASQKDMVLMWLLLCVVFNGGLIFCLKIDRQFLVTHFFFWSRSDVFLFSDFENFHQHCAECLQSPTQFLLS